MTDNMGNADKRKQIKDKRKKNIERIVFSTVALIVLVVVYFSLGNNRTIEHSPVAAKEITVVSDNGIISIDTDTISQEATFYIYKFGDTDIRFFAVLGDNNEIHVAFDACDVCHEAKKGYRQAGNLMECINCGRRFAIKGIGKDNIAGGCWPSYLPVRIEQGKILINTSDIEKKSHMF